MVDREELETAEAIMSIILDISMITATVIQIIEKLCDIFKPGKHCKK